MGSMDERHANSPSPYSHRSRFLGILGSTTGQRAKVNSSSPFPAGSKNVSALHVEPAIVATSAGLQQSRCPCLMLSCSQKLQAGAASSSPATGVGHTEPSRKVEPRGDTLVSTPVARVIPAALLCRLGPRGPRPCKITQTFVHLPQEEARLAASVALKYTEQAIS